MKSLTTPPLLCLASMLLATIPSQGALVVYESYSQDITSSAALNGKAGETGIGSWTATAGVNIATSTLTYGDLPNAGRQLNMTGNNIDASVITTSALADAGLLGNGKTLWFSFMYSKTASNGGNEKGGFAFGSERIDGAFNGTNMINSGNAIGAAITGGTITAGSWIGNGNVSLGTGSAATPNNASLMVVGQINWGATAGDNETITLYLQDTSNLGTLSSAISTRSMTGVDQSAFDTISMTTHQSTGTISYDEIRFGSTFDDVVGVVVPEPTAAFLGSLGLLGLLRRRR